MLWSTWLNWILTFLNTSIHLIPTWQYFHLNYCQISGGWSGVHVNLHFRGSCWVVQLQHVPLCRAPPHPPFLPCLTSTANLPLKYCSTCFPTPQWCGAAFTGRSVPGLAHSAWRGERMMRKHRQQNKGKKTPPEPKHLSGNVSVKQ